MARLEAPILINLTLKSWPPTPLFTGGLANWLVPNPHRGLGGRVAPKSGSGVDQRVCVGSGGLTDSRRPPFAVT